MTINNIEGKVNFLHGFGHKTRIEILYYLMDSEKSVSEILNEVHASQSSISQHIACLKGCGLIIGRQESKYIYYRLRNEHVKNLLLNIDEVVDDLSDESCCQHHIV